MMIGQRIKTMRKQQGLSIDELARRLNKNRTTIYRYENGDIENLPLGILDSLANALNTTPAYLMGWETSGQKWCDDIDPEYLNNEDREKIMEYANFLLSRRKPK